MSNKKEVTIDTYLLGIFYTKEQEDKLDIISAIENLLANYQANDQIERYYLEWITENTGEV